MSAHLWEADHPYYDSESGDHETHDSWAAFLEEMDDSNLDLNLLYRWDWVTTDEDGEPLSHGTGRLLLFYRLQRLGRNLSCWVSVTEADEPAVREWLAVRWAHLQRLWAPVSGGGA